MYLVRHCQAEGQAPEAILTKKGREQAEELADYLGELKIERIISSPYVRALQSIEPLANSVGIGIEEDERLSERVLAPEPHPDWLMLLQKSFDDLDFCVDGGESSREAMERAVAVLQDAKELSKGNVVMVTHGNLLSLLLKYFNEDVGFNEWERLSNPDLYSVSFSGEGTCKVVHIDL
ncbi:histidine phosphatase family protein [Bacillus fonticola]|uniref:histidine phosphatase family protein n=1 Tax=Bacillus fonticola TaxID=2728853 RepID=UPI002AD44CED|nr:histidine phosphatase family protein [Bacillus fonticola]